MTRRGRIRAIAARLGLVAAASGATLLALELVARTQVPSTAWSQLWAISTDTMLGVEPKPGVDFDFDGLTTAIPSTRVVTTAEGLRGDRPPAPKVLGGKRIVCIGDSVTFGWGVELEDTFCARLPPRLGPMWDSVNLGVPGYNLAQSVRRLQLRGLPMRPEVVVLVLNSNDFDAPIATDAARPPSWWHEHSALVRWIQLRLRRHEAAGESPSAGRAVLSQDAEAAIDALGRMARTGRFAVVVLLTFTPGPELPEALARIGAISAVNADVLRRPDLTIPGDGHPNAAGHAELTEQIALLELQIRR